MSQTKAEVYCRACGVKILTDFKLFGGEVCDIKCHDEFEWRRTLSILGLEYKPRPAKNYSEDDLLLKNQKVEDTKPNNPISEFLDTKPSVARAQAQSVKDDKVLYHDDDCGTPLQGGFCPKCQFAPSMQDTYLGPRPSIVPLPYKVPAPSTFCAVCGNSPPCPMDCR